MAAPISRLCRFMIMSFNRLWLMSSFCGLWKGLFNIPFTVIKKEDQRPT